MLYQLRVRRDCIYGVWVELIVSLATVCCLLGGICLLGIMSDNDRYISGRTLECKLDIKQRIAWLACSQHIAHTPHIIRIRHGTPSHGSHASQASHVSHASDESDTPRHITPRITRITMLACSQHTAQQHTHQTQHSLAEGHPSLAPLRPAGFILYISISICIYIYIHIYISFIYISLYINIYICIFSLSIYIYIYI